jgi:hypothetical protein
MRWFLLTLLLSSCAIFGKPVWASSDDDVDPEGRPAIHVCLGEEGRSFVEGLRYSLERTPDIWKADGDQSMLGWRAPTLDSPWEMVFTLKKTADQKWHVLGAQTCDIKGQQCKPMPLAYCGDWNEA